MDNKIFKLQGKVQHYAWGGFTFIPDLLGVANRDNKPFAEYWLGAHPSASSTVEMGEKQAFLNEVINNDPLHFIGNEINNKFGELPYLLKVLDVKEMLSIQVHPTKEEAIMGFEAEEKAGVPIDAPHRNYKDKNHKPEVMVALSQFWLLHGFKRDNEIRKVLNEVPELKFLLPDFEKGGYQEMYKKAMELTQHKVDEVLSSLVQREISRKNELTKDQPGYWVNKLYGAGQELKDIDRGIFSIYFFNIVYVQPGQAVFQKAGIPHAYLEGQNVELMANSDNVLRAGLTPKHVDLPELMKHTNFSGVEPHVMNGEKTSDTEFSYQCPVPDFSISMVALEVDKQYSHTSNSPEIYLVAEGEVDVDPVNEHYKKGEAFFVLPNAEISLTTKSKATIFKAFV